MLMAKLAYHVQDAFEMEGEQALPTIGSMYQKELEMQGGKLKIS